MAYYFASGGFILVNDGVGRAACCFLHTQCLAQGGYKCGFASPHVAMKGNGGMGADIFGELIGSEVYLGDGEGL